MGDGNRSPEANTKPAFGGLPKLQNYRCRRVKGLISEQVGAHYSLEIIEGMRFRCQRQTQAAGADIDTAGNTHLGQQ